MAYAIRHMRKSYPTNLTDAQWHYLKSHLPTLKKARTTENPGLPREILDSASYILRSGVCLGRLSPRDLEHRGRASIIASDNGASMEPLEKVNHPIR